MHFYEGTQLRIDEFCIDINYQKRGFGSLFTKLLSIKNKRVKYFIYFT